ncbi:unnamed protein product [Camellia sinensis]
MNFPSHLPLHKTPNSIPSFTTALFFTFPLQTSTSKSLHYQQKLHKNVEPASTHHHLPLLLHSFCSISSTTSATSSYSVSSTTSPSPCHPVSATSTSSTSPTSPVSTRTTCTRSSPTRPTQHHRHSRKGRSLLYIHSATKGPQIDNQIYKLLNDSSQSLTVFAPSDNAFGNLTTGTLNSFSDEKKVQLVKFHVIPSFLSIPAFQTVSNPLSTQAGSTVQYPMNVTTAGNLVNIRTGIVNTTVTGTVYSDNQLAVYQVDRVLLPLSFFVSISPAPAPSKPVKKAPSPVSDQSASSTDASVQASGVVPHRAFNVAVWFAGLVIAVRSLVSGDYNATAHLAQPPQVPATQSPPLALAPQVPLVQSPPAQLAPGPAPPGPPNITAILEKAGHFSTYIRLLKATQIDNQIYKLLNDSSQSLTVFAPSDNAFGNLTTGTLNSFSDEQKVQLVKFHVIPSFLSIPTFQTVSNPLRTQARSTVQYPMNVTTAGNLVNIRTGIVNTTVTSTVYSDNQLAVYQVDRVLLPLSFFVSISPAPAPSKPVKKAPSPVSDQSASSTDASVQASGVVPHRAFNVAVWFAGLVIAVVCFCL